MAVEAAVTATAASEETEVAAVAEAAGGSPEGVEAAAAGVRWRPPSLAVARERRLLA